METKEIKELKAKVVTTDSKEFREALAEVDAVTPGSPRIDPVGILALRVEALEKSVAELTEKVKSMYVAPVPVDGNCKSNTWNEAKKKLVRCIWPAGHAPLPCDFGPKD
jgi:hypothetical protein